MERDTTILEARTGDPPNPRSDDDDDDDAQKAYCLSKWFISSTNLCRFGGH
jgi:hypothetical protein